MQKYPLINLFSSWWWVCQNVFGKFILSHILVVSQSLYFLLFVNSSMHRSQLFPYCIYQNYIWYYMIYNPCLNRTIIVLRNFKTLGVDLSILNGNFTSAWNFLFGGGGAKMIITIFQYSICRPSSFQNSFVSDFTCCCVLDDDLKIFYSYLWISIRWKSLILISQKILSYVFKTLFRI